MQPPIIPLKALAQSPTIQIVVRWETAHYPYGGLSKNCHVTSSLLDTQTSPFSTRDIAHSTRTEFSLIPPGYFISGILSADISLIRIPHIRRMSGAAISVHPDVSHPAPVPHPTPVRGRHSIHPDVSHPVPIRGHRSGWERRTIQLPRVDISGSPHLAPGVWTIKPPGFPCFLLRLSWVQDLPMRPISPGLNQVAKGLTPIHYPFKTNHSYSYTIYFI